MSPWRPHWWPMPPGRTATRLSIVTADSDLRPALHAARQQFGVRVGVINPLSGGRAMALREDADFHLRPARADYLLAQFPRTMSDQHGAFRAPKGWANK